MNDYSDDPDFERILNLQPEDIDRPAILPTGMYLCAIKQRYEMVKSSQKGTPGVSFVFTIVGVIDEVNEKELQAAGGCVGKVLFHTFWLPASDPDSMKGRMDWRIHDFLDACEVPTGMMRERLDACFGAQFGAKVTKDPKSEIPRNIITKFFRPMDYEPGKRLPLNEPPPKAVARGGRR
jgi:hypothetical protein